MRWLKLITGIALSILLYLIIILTSIPFFLVSLVLFVLTVFFDKKRTLLHLYTSACLIFWGTLMPLWRIRVSGRHKKKGVMPCVIVSNHQSWLDILVSAYVFADFKWISKAEILKVPFIGWQMALNNYITIKRGYLSSTDKMMKSCIDRIHSGSSVWIFPEGTRSTGIAPAAFKSGAFVTARQCGVPILPVVIHGTGDALPPGRFFTSGLHNISVAILDPFFPDDYSGKKPEIFAEEIRQLIGNHLAVMSQRSSQPT